MQKFMKILLSLLFFGLVMTLLSPFYVHRSIDIELTYTSETNAILKLEAFRTQEAAQATIYYDMETYELPSARQPRTVRLPLPCDNRVGCVLFYIPELASSVKIMDASIVCRGKRHSLLDKKLFLDLNARKHNRLEQDVLCVRPGRRIYVRFYWDDMLKVTRRIDLVPLLYMALLSLLPSLLVYRKVNFELSKIGAGQLLYSTIALVFLVYPVLQIDYYSVISRENRFMDAFPPFLRYRQMNVNFPRQVEAWLMDRFAGRDQAIKKERMIFAMDYGSSPDKRVIMGEKGWMFQKTRMTLDMFQNKNRFTDSQLETCARNVILLNNYCQKRNMKLYILLTPDKERVYSEYYPASYKKMHPQSRLEQLYDYLSQHTPVKIVCPLKQMLEARKESPMYFKTGSHWSYRGAYIGLSLLLQAIQKDFPNLPMEQPNATQWYQAPCADTDIAGIAGYTDPMTQLPKEELMYDRPMVRCAYTANKVEECTLGHCTLTEYTAVNPLPGSLRMFACTDSFFTYGLPFMFPAANYLSRAFYNAGGNFELSYVQAYLEKTQVDVMIIESTERFLDRFLVIGFEELQ